MWPSSVREPGQHALSHPQEPACLSRAGARQRGGTRRYVVVGAKSKGGLSPASLFSVPSACSLRAARRNSLKTTTE